MGNEKIKVILPIHNRYGQGKKMNHIEKTK